VIPPDASAAFVANMEDVLEVYQRPHDPQRPLEWRRQSVHSHRLHAGDVGLMNS
jgi:hypothetical protein